MNIQLHKQKPNNNAVVGFIIWYPFHYFVYKNVYKHISERAEFIIDIGSFIPGSQPESLLVDIIQLLEKDNVYFRILAPDFYKVESFLYSFFAKYRVLVSVWMTGCVKLDATKNITKVNLTYGVGKELTTFSLQKKDFDVILTYGNFNHKFYSLMTESVIIGNPKFDDWFEGNFDSTLIESLKLISEKKTILYLPTHSDLSSVREMMPVLNSLTNDYNVIVKFHYLTIREEPELLILPENSKLVFLKDDSDILTLFKIADVVLSDNSTSIFEAILADKPIIVTDFHTERFLNIEHKKIKLSSRGYIGPLTYSGSIEQKIKKDGVVHVIKKPSELKFFLKESLIENGIMKKKRDLLRNSIYEYQDNKCGLRGAQVIYNFIEGRKKTEKPLLYHLVNDLEKKINLNITPKNFTSKATIVIFDQENQSFEDKIFSLHSVISTVLFSKMDVDVFLITKNYEQVKLAVSKLNINFQKNLVKIISQDRPLGVLFKDVVNESKGDILFFTTTSCIVPKNWIETFSGLYGEHSDTAGIGGYCKKHRKTNIFDEYEYFLLARCLGLPINKLGYIKNVYEFKNSDIDQNPFGSIKNSSYKKSLFMNNNFDYSIILNLDSLEFFLRSSVFSQGKALFYPLSILDMEVGSLSALKRRFFHCGYFEFLLSIRYPSLLGSYNPIRKTIEDVVVNLLKGYWKFRMTLVIIVSVIFYFFGYGCSYYKNFNLKFKQKYV